MAHVRRIGLYASGITFATLLTAAFIAEGIGLAVIVAVPASSSWHSSFRS
jgi:hypothetical protein